MIQQQTITIITMKNNTNLTPQTFQQTANTIFNTTHYDYMSFSIKFIIHVYDSTPCARSITSVIKESPEILVVVGALVMNIYPATQSEKTFFCIKTSIKIHIKKQCQTTVFSLCV